jgi:hypothetical protein
MPKMRASGPKYFRQKLILRGTLQFRACEIPYRESDSGDDRRFQDNVAIYVPADPSARRKCDAIRIVTAGSPVRQSAIVRIFAKLGVGFNFL